MIGRKPLPMTQAARSAVWMGCALALALACEEKKSDSASSGDAAVASTAPVVDPSLAKAVASARGAGPAAPVAAEGDGPPPTGVFPPGAADEQHKKGEAPKLAVGSTGSEPRVALRTPLEPGWKQTGSVAVSLRAGRQMLPPVTLEMSFSAAKPKPDDPPGVPVAVKVTGAKMGDVDGQPAPKDLSAQIAKMKGSRLDYRVLPSGVAVEHRYELPMGADPNLNTILRSVSETLAATSLSYPEEPVGAGAYWLITSREFISGADVVQYRMVKLTSVEGGKLTLSINAKRYSATPKLTLHGLPPGDLTLEEFQSTADGDFEATKGAFYPQSGELKSVLNAALAPAAQPDQRMGVQSLADATLSFQPK